MINNDLTNDKKQVSASANKNSLQPFADFSDWFRLVTEETKPAIVVGIARGAIRLLQLQNAYHVLNGVPIVSHYALPFLSDSQIKGKRVLLFDDSVIFGSTMSKIRDYLITRGGTVFCASYVVDRFSLYGETKSGSGGYDIPSKFCNLPIRSKHRLWPDAIRRHHSILIRSLLQTSSHYNLDFPTFCLRVPEYSSGDIPYLITLLRKTNIFREFFDVSSSASSEHGIYRYAGLFEPLSWNLFPEDGLFCRQYSKTRTTFVPRLGEIQFTPIPQLTMTGSTIYEDVNFTDDTLLPLWHRLHPPYHREDPFYHQALFRLLTSFVAVIMGEVIVRQSTLALRLEFPVKQIRLLPDDIRCVIGIANSRALEKIFSLLRVLSVIPGQSTKKLGTIVNFRESFDQNFFRAVVNAWRRYPNLKPHPGELVYEILGKVFLTLRMVTDSQECRRKNPDVSRLETGFSYEGIRQLLREDCKIILTADEVSLGIDICVDNGQSVPKVIAQDSTWLRAFYSGEGEDSQDTLQLKNAIHKGYSEFLQQKRVRPLSPFDIHKLSATLKNLFHWLPISTRYYTFGIYSRVGQSEVELVSWLTHKSSGPLKIHTEEHKKILLLNETYKPCIKPTWPPNESRDFYDAFQYIAAAFSRLPDKPKLLLSTCRTHRHTYNAVAFEAHSWVGQNYGNFRKFLSGIQLSTDKNPEITSDAVSSLYWCTRYISEAWKKYDVFHKEFNVLLKRLKKSFERQGQAGKRFWEYYIEEKDVLDISPDQEIKYRFELLMPLLMQMLRLTAFVTKILIDFEILSLDELQQKFEREGTSLGYKEFGWLTEQECRIVASRYNNDIKQRRITGLSIVKTELPLDIPFKRDDSVMEWLHRTLDTVKKCFGELRTSLTEFCPEYEVAEGDFPFSPDSSKRVLPNGSVERTLSDIYILTMDVIGSTDSEQTNEFKNCVIRIFEQFEQAGLYFEETGNDAFIVCSEDPTILWDIANLAKVEGERFKRAGGRFKGTRKGLYFGTVRIVEKSDGHVMIKDAWPPHMIPRAFGILQGVDDYCNEYSVSKNSVIIVEEKTAKQCAQVLKLNLGDNEPFWVRSKHFHGRCCLFGITNTG